jgi:pimeloyl-ACP methyl ester carboxylesterase
MQDIYKKMTLSDWEKGGKFFHYHGHRIFFREAGHGENVLLLHGFPTASWDWNKIWEPLAERFHLIAPDLIGFGFSDKPQRYDYSLKDQASLCEALLTQLGVRHVHILAHDYGDTVAQELLARWLERSSSLDIYSITLLNGGIFPDMHHPRFIQKLLASPLGKFLAPLMGKRQLRKTFREIFGKNTLPSEADIDDFWQLIACNDGKKVIPKLIRYMQERRRFAGRWVGALKQCPLPLCHINGSDDPISGQHAGEFFQKTIPRAEVHLLDKVGHYPQVEAPELVSMLFLEFVSK